MPLSNSEILRGKMSLTSRDFYLALDGLWHQPDMRRTFLAFNVLLHQIMRASVPLLKLALARSEVATTTDPVCCGLVDYLRAHVEEERHHDQWALDDLEAAGIPRPEVLGQPPSPTVASLVGAQYYWIEHFHPVALLGYIAILEGNPPSKAHIDRLRDLSGLPEEAFRTYRKHGELDPHHGAELDRLLDALPLQKVHNSLVGMSAAHTARLFATAIRELILPA